MSLAHAKNLSNPVSGLLLSAFVSANLPDFSVDRSAVAAGSCGRGKGEDAFARNAAAAYSFTGTVRRAFALIPDIKADEAATLVPAEGADMRGYIDDPCRQVLPAKLEKLFR